MCPAHSRAPVAATRKERAAATRAALIKAARELWAEKGFFATSTSDIVASAGVGTRGAFYAHFADREQLFLAVFADIHASLSSELDRGAEPAADPLMALQAVLLDFLDVVVESREAQALLIDGPAIFGTARWQQAEEDRGLAPIEERLRSAVTAGVIEPQPVRPLARILLMLVNDTALIIAASADQAATRAEAGGALGRLIGGLRSEQSRALESGSARRRRQ